MVRNSIQHFKPFTTQRDFENIIFYTDEFE